LRTAGQIAAMLVAGTLERAQWPELDDEDLAAEVRERLGAVGLDLVGAEGKWLARPEQAPTDDVEGFEAVFSLNSVELAVVAALYLHLRFLPRHASSAEEDPEQQPSISVEELLWAFPGYKARFIAGRVLGRLRRAGFVRRENDRLFAGPYLAVINGVEADERAQAALGSFQLRRYLKRRAEELEEGEHASG
jgi:hypothetical protein